MNAAGIDVSSRKSTVAVLRPFGEVVRLPFDMRHSAEDLQHASADEPVFQFLDKKRAEGKPYYVYMTAAGNKFLRRYYGKVMAYFSTLEVLPPVDMDSTGPHRAE